MAYVKRDSTGKILQVFDSPQADANEFLSLNSSELIAFLGESAQSDSARTILSSSDAAMIRVLEDLIETLIDKGVILFTDLPAAAQQKLTQRQHVRSRLQALENLMDEEQDLF